jgi:Acyl-coenzyme A synthetases/AMP-(fatty) acid ligases
VTRQPGTLPPLEVDSEAPYLLAYTSGTTGRPKGALHVQGSFLVSIAREAAYQSTSRPATGSTSPPTWAGSWDRGRWSARARSAQRRVRGGRARLACRPALAARRVGARDDARPLAHARPRAIPHGEPTADLSSLKTFCTTGEPWNPDPYLWLFEKAGGSRAPIVNISGGTEVGACFLATCITEPVKPVALGFPALGQDMDVVDAAGDPVRGEVGELVCRRPWPGMTRGVWGDDERYLETYWRRFPGIWTHGDWASIDEDGYWFLHGRSDDTLNIAGKRIGRRSSSRRRSAAGSSRRPQPSASRTT